MRSPAATAGVSFAMIAAPGFERFEQALEIRARTTTERHRIFRACFLEHGGTDSIAMAGDGGRGRAPGRSRGVALGSDGSSRPGAPRMCERRALL